MKTTAILENVRASQAKIELLSDEIISAQEKRITKLELMSSVLSVRLAKHLDEIEGKFDRTSDFDSPEACSDYMDSALFMQNYFGRKNNRYAEAKHWYDNYSLPFPA